jgi:hypothetical protein
MDYNVKLSNDGYISLIFRNRWVGALYLFHKKSVKIVVVMGIVTFGAILLSM